MKTLIWFALLFSLSCSKSITTVDIYDANQKAILSHTAQGDSLVFVTEDGMRYVVVEKQPDKPWLEKLMNTVEDVAITVWFGIATYKIIQP